MGNNSSSDAGIATRASRSFGKTTTSLGLSKSELDKRCKPSGLYPTCQWEDKVIRRLVGDGRLAARLRGSDTRHAVSDRECPICFLQYSQVNVTLCCNASICTECYLQVRPQKEKHCVCPFCNHAKLTVTVAKKMDADDVQQRQQDEQRVIEAAIRARANSNNSTNDTNASSPDSPSTPSSGFGSSLEQNSVVQLMRARSGSVSSEGHEPISDDHFLSSLAMTAEDRRALEEEMRAQHRHPLARQIEEEAEQRRLENERNYYRSTSGRFREIRTAEFIRSRGGSGRRSRGSGRLHNETAHPSSGTRRSGRNWNDIVAAFESGGNGEIHSLDDLVVLEAAILLSMEEEARSRRVQNDETDDEGGTVFDASQHARDGFPLLQRFLSARNADEASNVHENSMDLTEQLQGLARSLSASRRRRNQSGRALSIFSPNDSAALGSSVLRGLSESEQIEMAIALSLQHSEQGSAEGTESETTTVADEEEEGDHAALQPGHPNQSEESAPPTEQAPTVLQSTVSDLLDGHMSIPTAMTTKSRDSIIIDSNDYNAVESGATVNSEEVASVNTVVAESQVPNVANAKEISVSIPKMSNVSTPEPLIVANLKVPDDTNTDEVSCPNSEKVSAANSEVIAAAHLEELSATHADELSATN